MSDPAEVTIVDVTIAAGCPFVTDPLGRWTPAHSHRVIRGVGIPERTRTTYVSATTLRLSRDATFTGVIDVHLGEAW